MTEEKWEWRAGYDYATEKYKSRIDELERFAELGRAEIDRLRTVVEELRECLIYACNQLEGYEETRTGESYNDTRINAILAKTAKENQQ